MITSERLLHLMVDGTETTETGERVGVEIETDFVHDDGTPPSVATTQTILAAERGRPRGCVHKLELGRQKIELAIDAQPSARSLIERAREALHWLCGIAARYGLHPIEEPGFEHDGDLLLVTNARDALWVNIDGRPALEELCRCSSVQFTIDVNPYDAVRWINRLWERDFQSIDYAENTRRWRNYLERSRARHPAARFGGPSGFTDLADYTRQLSRLPVLMDRGEAVCASAAAFAQFDLDSFLRSVWWHYRLRRFGAKLALEVRPIARRANTDLDMQWARLAETLGT